MQGSFQHSNTAAGTRGMLEEFWHRATRLHSFLFLLALGGGVSCYTPSARGEPEKPQAKKGLSEPWRKFPCCSCSRCELLGL